MRKIHLISESRTITPCGLSESHNVIKTALNPKKVTCLKCKATNWYKQTKKKWA